MKNAELDRLLTVNAVFWDQAADLVAMGYQLNAYLREGAKGYNVTFSTTDKAKTLVAIDKKSTSAEPAEVEGISLFQIMATHSQVDSFVLPLVPFGQEPKEATKCIIRMQRPNPKIHWTLEIKGKPIKGDRNKPLRFGVFTGLIETARFATATEAELIISPPTRQYFQARLQRSQWVSKELAKKNLNLRTWCLENGQKYHAFYHVLHRGDDIKDVKNQLARIAKRKVLEMWPKIDWS